MSDRMAKTGENRVAKGEVVEYQHFILPIIYYMLNSLDTYNIRAVPAPAGR
mgnify:CR=1 FL=1